MRVKFVTAFAVIFVGLTSAEWIDFGTGVSEAKIEILEQNSTHTKLEVTVPGIEVQQEAVGGRVFTRLSVPGSGAMPDSIGRPEIPRVPVLLAVPCGAQVTVTLVERRVRIVEAKDVYPLQPPLPDGFSNPDFVVDQDFYSRSGPYPQSPVHASDVQVWRDLKLVPVSISLVCVKPAEGTLEVASKLTLNVSYEGGKYPEKVPGWMDPIYSCVVDNYKDLPVVAGTDHKSGTRYLVFCHSNYSQSAWLHDSLLGWIRKRGYETHTITASQFDKDEVLDSIRAAYNSDSTLRWVLLVGEHSEIPMYHREAGRIGDVLYGYLDGSNDFYPEVGIGRLSPSSVTDLENQVRKILRYQRNPSASDTGADYQWTDSLLLVAHWQSPYMDAIRTICGMGTYTYHDPVRCTIMGIRDSNMHVANAVNSGFGAVYYRGHGSDTSWSNWSSPGGGVAYSWGTSNVASLTNGGMTPVVYGPACATGNIGIGTCLTEAWMRMYPGGAVAAMGATGVTDRESNDTLCAAAVRAVTKWQWVVHEEDGGRYRGPAFDLGGAQMLMNAYTRKTRGGSGWTSLSQCVLLGDPATAMWGGGVPQEPVVSHPTTIPWDRPCSVHVYVSVAGRPVGAAMVCLDEVSGAYYDAQATDHTGKASFGVDLAHPGVLDVTVSEGHSDHWYEDSSHTPTLPYRGKIHACGWGEVASMPVWPGPSPRRVYKGGWLAYNEGNGLIYGAKGAKTIDFYSYDPDSDFWSPALEGMPYWKHPDWHRKPPYDGSKGVCDGDNVIYVTQGYNTCGWWAYSISGDSWYYLADVPLGDSRKKVKYGTDLAYVPGDTDYVYCLKGYRNEFYRYDISADSWEELAAVPGIYHGIKWDRGSWLVWDGDRYLYAHRAKYHELHRYDLETQSWDTAFVGMPFMGMKLQSKRSRGGGSAVWVDSIIFALKGGNSQEFWMYSPAANEWAELETIPAYGSTDRKKRVRHGADVVFAEGKFYALKGNRTVEFWCHVPQPGGSAWRVSGKRKTALDGGFGEETICEGWEAERPRWSANGQYICYVKDVDGYNQVFMKEYGSQEPEVQLTDIETDCENPVFSLQNDWIAFQMDDTVEGFWQICRVRTSESGWGGVDGRTPEGSVSTSGIPTAADPSVSAEVSPVHQVPAEVPGFDYDIEQLTTVTEADHANPEYSPDGTKLAFQRDLAGYYQICVMSSEGGDVTQLTNDEADHEWPVWLDNNTIVYQKWEDEDYIQLCKVNINTQAETWLTNGDYDHELPCASSDGNYASYQVMDDDGVYQIGLVSAGGGDEEMLTESDQDLEQPDWSQDNTSIYATRCHGLCNSIVLVDAVEGGYEAVTDSNAIRENPDTWYDKEGTNNNFVIYSREDTSTSGTFGRPRRGRRYKQGTGIFLTRAIRARGGGTMSSGITAVQLFRAAPNPAAGPVRIRWQVPKLGQVSLRAYNIAGQCVATMVDAQAKPGVYETLWTGCDNHGRRLGAGVYFYTLKTEDDKLTHKVVLTSKK